MKLWIDDERPMPEGYDTHAKNGAEAIVRIVTGNYKHIAFDHDLGSMFDLNGADVAKVAAELYSRSFIPEFTFSVHSASFPGATRIRGILDDAGLKEQGK